jgi:SAM-dependent methyltransferase
MGDYEQLNVQLMGSESDPFTESRYKQFYRYIPPQVESVLDLGCNTGRGGRVLKQLRPSLSLTALDVVRNRLDRLPVEVYSHLVCASATEIPGEDNQYDVVVAGEGEQTFLDLLGRLKDSDWRMDAPLEDLPGLNQAEIRELWISLVYNFFSLVKFYREGLAADDPENYYMEREWRVFGSLEFSLSDVRRVIFPAQYAKRFRQDLPDYYGEITFS